MQILRGDGGEADGHEVSLVTSNRENESTTVTTVSNMGTLLLPPYDSIVPLGPETQGITSLLLPLLVFKGLVSVTKHLPDLWLLIGP